MKRRIIAVAAVGLMGWVVVLPAQGWMVSQEAEQTLAPDQNMFELELDGHIRLIGGGKDPVTNAFVGPLLQQQTDQGAPPAYPYTLMRFMGINGALKAVIPNSPGVKRQFGVFGDGPQVPIITETHWGVDCTVPQTGALDFSTCEGPPRTVPTVSAQFAYDPAGDVAVTLVNQTTQDITVSQVGYRILKINSFRLEDLNRAHMPPSSFTSAAVAVPDGTVLLAFGGSEGFTVTGVGLHDDVVVYAQSDFNPAPGTPNPGGTWVAWNSGTYVPARKPYLGRFQLSSVQSVASNTRSNTAYATLTGLQNAAHTDLMAKLPFKTIKAVGGAAPGRYFGYTRLLVEPGEALAEYFPNAKNTLFGDLLLSSTHAGGLKRGYFRTAGQDVYTVVRVFARVLPGASSNSTLSTRIDTVAPDDTPIPLVSDDLGGPVAIRISPTGDSYYASVLTRNPTQIDLVKEIGGVKTVIATTGAGAAWANGDPILIDRNDPNPMPAGPSTYHPKVYDISLQAVGTTLTLQVTEVQWYTPVVGSGAPGHTRTLVAVDGSLAEGYVGLRTERNGSLDFPSDANGASSVKFETMVRDFRIEDPNAVYTTKIALGVATRVGVDNPNNDGGTLSTDQTDQTLNDAEIAEMAFSVGIKADLFHTLVEMDDFSYSGAYADGPTAFYFEQPPFNSNYNLYWQSGTSAGGTTAYGTMLLNIPIIFAEHGIGGNRRCEANGLVPTFTIPHHVGDACTACCASGSPYDVRAGMFASNSDPDANVRSGDFRGSGSTPWSGLSGSLINAPDQIRVLKASGDPSGTNGNPNHPLVAGLADVNGFIQIYAWPWRHVVGGGSLTSTATVLAVDCNSALAGGADGFINQSPTGHPSWGLIVAEPGMTRAAESNASTPNTTFAARNVFYGVGDAMFHRLTARGREIARRSLYYSLGLAIPPSPFLYYGDFDEDGDVDGADYAHFLACKSGSGVLLSYENQCDDADADGDGDVDDTDLAVINGCFSGAGIEPVAACQTPRISIPGPPPAAAVVCTRSVVGRWVFFNNSFYDTPSTGGQGCNTLFGGGAPCNDNSARSPNITALLPGQTVVVPVTAPHGVVTNHSNYTKGINGIMIDLTYTGGAGCALAAGTLTAPQVASTLEFIESSGRGVTSAYTGANRTATATVSIAPHPTLASTDRVTIIFPDNTSTNARWLRTRLLTGGVVADLAGVDTFYFGLQKADGYSPASGFAVVDINDQGHPKTPNAHNTFARAPINESYDYDHNSLVDINDQGFPKAPNAATTFTALQLTGVAP